MRVIMHNAKDESSESIKIMQEHNWIMNFLKNRLTAIKKVSASSNPIEPKSKRRFE